MMIFALPALRFRIWKCLLRIIGASPNCGIFLLLVCSFAVPILKLEAMVPPKHQDLTLYTALIG
jgi:hypothetical protein